MYLLGSTVRRSSSRRRSVSSVSGTSVGRKKCPARRTYSWSPTLEPLSGWSARARARDRKSTRLNSSHVESSYAVFCLKKKRGGVPGGGARQEGHGRGDDPTRGRRGRAPPASDDCPPRGAGGLPGGGSGCTLSRRDAD